MGTGPGSSTAAAAVCVATRGRDLHSAHLALPPEVPSVAPERYYVRLAAVMIVVGIVVVSVACWVEHRQWGMTMTMMMNVKVKPAIDHGEWPGSSRGHSWSSVVVGPALLLLLQRR